MSAAKRQCPVYQRDGRYWFKNRAGDLEYGPYKERTEARRDRKQYLRFIEHANSR